MSLFGLGHMERPEYAYGVFKQHFERFVGRGGKFVILEIGPGDSLFSALISHAFGASACCLIDVGSFATTRMRPYSAMVSFLRDKGFRVEDLAACKTVDELLATCSAQYLTNGLDSLRSLPDKSVDFIWSHTVLQHIRKSEFPNYFKEARRVIRDDGISSHRVDLRDMLGGHLNNLRFRVRVWESQLMASSGFYTNRLRYSEMLEIFQQVGFQCDVVHADRWAQLPTPEKRLSEEFRRFTKEDLCVSGFDVVLHPSNIARISVS